MRWRSVIAMVLLFMANDGWAASNIVVILADDLSIHGVNAYGEPLGGVENNTPNIDSIAKHGVKFTNGFFVTPICAASRAVFYTGQGPWQTHVDRNGASLADTIPTVMDSLVGAGYETWIFGKWQLQPMTGDNLGWTYRYLCAQAECSPNYNNSTISINGGTASRVSGYITDVITDAFLAKAEARTPGIPFFAVLSHKAPHEPFVPHMDDEGDLDTTPVKPLAAHDDRSGRARHMYEWPATILNLYADWISTPWQTTFGKHAPPATLETEGAKAAWVSQEAGRDYLETIRALDRSVGRILAYLDAEADRDGVLADHTIVCFTSDNGLEIGMHGLNGKLLSYDESAQMVLLCKGPGIRASTTNAGLISNLDLAPTWLDIANAAKPSAMTGRSLLELLAVTPPTWRTGVYFDVVGSRKDESERVASLKSHYAYITANWKLIRWPENSFSSGPEWELIDRANDPYELRNVYHDKANASTVSALKAALLSIRRHYAITR